ncbi:hypothetical protein MRBLMS1_001992 [Massilia sp. LMS1-1-1.1]
MPDVVDNILNVLKVRMSNSFMSSVIISWPIINYKLIMVIFGGGDYAQKIEYIDNSLYKSGFKYWYIAYLPICVGLFYVFIFPFIDILINIIGMYFKNLERRFVFWRQKKDVMSVAEKEYHFSDLIATNKSLEAEMAVIRNSYADQISMIKNNAERVNDRFKSVVFQNVSFGLNGATSWANSISALWQSGVFQPDHMKREMYAKFANSELFSNLRKLASRLVELDYATDTRNIILTKGEIQQYSGVLEEDCFDDFINAVLTFGILKEIDFPGGRYRTDILAKQNLILHRLISLSENKPNL